jgi:hypothetical protein
MLGHREYLRKFWFGLGTQTLEPDLGFKFQGPHLFNMQSWVRFFTFQCLIFCICETEKNHNVTLEQ